MLKELTEKMVAAFNEENDVKALKLLKQILIELQNDPQKDGFPAIDRETFALLNENDTTRGVAFLAFVAMAVNSAEPN